MRYSAATRIITLLFSTSLIVGFLLYRTGKFDSVFSAKTTVVQQSPNEGALKYSSSDTIVKPLEDSAARQLRLASSKSLILTDSKDLFFSTDSILSKIDTAKLRKIQNDRTQRELLYSTKSAPVFLPSSPIKFDTATLRKLIKKKN